MLHKGAFYITGNEASCDIKNDVSAHRRHAVSDDIMKIEKESFSN